MRRIAGGLVLAVALSAVAAGCGGPIRQDELRRGVETIQSYAAEGHLLAGEAARGRSKNTFVRVRAGELAERAEHEAEKLHDAGAQPSTAAAKGRAVALASAMSDELSRLQIAPGDERVARDVEHRLAQLAARATRLSEAL
jgi:hypothetical protein